MKITVLSRPEIEQGSLPTHSHAVISIADPGVEPKIPTNNWTVQVLSLRFFDVDRDVGPEYHPIPNRLDAGRIVNFIKLLRPLKPKELFVHCEAGISRSSATALAIGNLFRGVEFDLNPMRHNPNGLLYDLIMQEGKKRIRR